MPVITARRRDNALMPNHSTGNYITSKLRCESRLYDSDSGPNAEHDNDHGDIRRISIFPSADEILSLGKPVYVPKKNIDSPNPYPPGRHRHLDLMFRQLRHESIEQIKAICYSAAQTSFLSSAEQVNTTNTQYHISKPMTHVSLPPTATRFEPHETPMGHRFYLYRGARVEELIANEQHTLLVRISFECPESLRKKPISKCGHLEEGMMVALLCHNKQTHKFYVQYFSIHLAQSTRSMESRDGTGQRAAVLVIPMPCVTDNDVHELAQYAQGLDADTEFCLVEFPKLMHHGFYHCLTKLQHDVDFAFQQYLAPNTPLPATQTVQSRSERLVGPPEYARKPYFSYDLSSVLKSDGQDNKTTYTLEELGTNTTLKRLRNSGVLDQGQAVAFQHCLMRELAFVQGPPGTGKTYLGIQLTKVLLASQASHKPVLVVCLTNHAIDNFLAGLMSAGVTDIIRIGSGSKEEWTDPHNLRSKARKATLSPNEKSQKGRARAAQDSILGHIKEWCQGASRHALTGQLAWYAIEKHLSATQPAIHRQLQMSKHPSVQEQLFEHWTKGGDIRELQRLRDALLDTLSPAERRKVSKLQAETPDGDIYSAAQSGHLQKGVENVWRMSPYERRSLVDDWQKCVQPNALADDLLQYFRNHQHAKGPTREVNDQVDVRVLSKANVIGMTTAACARRWQTLKQLGVEVVLFEEAGEIMEAQSLCALLPSVKHAISIGDPEQLRPEVSNQRLTLENCPDFRLDESLFERMISSPDPRAFLLEYEQLTIQRRMHPEIADITRLIYPFLKDHQSTSNHAATFGLARRLFWWDHRVPELNETSTTKSHINDHEVNMVTSLVHYLVKGSGYAQGDIAVLTPYTGQLAALHKSLSLSCHVWLDEADRQKLLTEEQLEIDATQFRTQDEVVMSDMLRVTTVDNFQGEEAKIVILSTVRSGGKPGFLAIKNRINVACSRAREGFYIIGNSETLGQVPRWRKVIDLLGPDRVGVDIEVCCENHLKHTTLIRDPHEFETIEHCSEFCATLLKCGHKCNRQCHPQSLHVREVLPCAEICGKTLMCGHLCSRPCGVECGACQVALREIVLECGHLSAVLCSGDATACTVVLGEVQLECGHKIDHVCGKNDPQDSDCKQSCQKILDCGHPCTSICAECRGSGHPSCTHSCGNELECGHGCVAPCGHECECPPCKQLVKVICEHATTTRMCNASPQLCMQPQSSSCHHQKNLQIPCAFPQPILPCSEGCTKKLACGHFCPSIDGEICVPVELCYECKGTAVARPVLYMPDCGHVAEVNEMDQQNIQGVFEQESDGSMTTFGQIDISQLQLPKCLCGTPCPGVRRYQMVSKLTTFQSNAYRMYGEILGAKFWYLSCQLKSAEADLNLSWSVFKNNIHTAGSMGTVNVRLVQKRLSGLVSIREEISKYHENVVKPFEKALDELSKHFRCFTAWTLTLDLRFQVLLIRAASLWAGENVRIGHHLLEIADVSEQAQRSGTVTLQLACNVLDSSTQRLVTAALQNEALCKSPGVLAELRLHQLHFWLLTQQCIDTLSKSGSRIEAREHSFTSIPGLLSNLGAIIDTSSRFPKLCASLKGTASAYQIILHKARRGEVIRAVPAPDLSSALNLEVHLRKYMSQDPIFVTCPQNHLYSEVAFGKDGCPECGTMIKLENEQFRDSGKSLFENDFLTHMQKIKSRSTDALSPGVHTTDSLTRTERSASGASFALTTPESEGTAVTDGEDVQVRSEDDSCPGKESLQLSIPENPEALEHSNRTGEETDALRKEMDVTKPEKSLEQMFLDAMEQMSASKSST